MVRFALNLDNGRSEMDVSGLVKLDLAAARLGRHVETLRIRVRDGRLPAVRGPHGAYYVSEPALAALPPEGRRVPERAAVTAAERERSWELVEQLITKGRRAAHDEMLAFVRMIKEKPDQNRRLYPLLAVNGMVLAGLSSEQIANELGISARHVRRLADRSPLLAVRKGLFSKTTQAEAEARKRARHIVAELRAALQASGFRPHLDTGRDWPAPPEDEPRPAFTQRTLNSAERGYLRAAELTEAQIDAIATVGVGTDELQELLLRGIEQIVGGTSR
jgi:hypothetical protein